MTDPRYVRLRAGLDQLSDAQLAKVLTHPAPMCYDTWNYDEATGFY